MIAAMHRDRVNGFLDTRGTKIVNGKGEEVLLTGWGLGNWLLTEGYMWLAGGRMDRPRGIEQVLREVAGEDYAKAFWKKFRKYYITEKDIALMAAMGYNSVRIPINARLFMEEGPGIHWVDEGWDLLDKCIDWCEKHKLYAFIDLHGAPGGQTGSNIDDSIDDIARLFVDRDNFDKGIALWKKIAQRYKDRWIVGGYDILNEPLRPVMWEGQKDLAYLLPRLKEFYREAVKAIREVDTVHALSIEGHRWASDPTIFDEKYDEKMIIHFHGYAFVPDVLRFEPWARLSEKVQSPLWLGETGENDPEWFTAVYPVAAQLGVGYNLWPWKKMRCENSICSVKVPKGWESIAEYAAGGSHPGYERAQQLLDEYLENIKLENCTVNDWLNAYVFRTPGCTIRATDFDDFGGNGGSYQCLRDVENPFGYREETGMEIVERFPDLPKRFFFDTRWKRFVLGLEAGEFACYTLYDVGMNTDKNTFADIEYGAQTHMEVHCYCDKSATVNLYQDETLLGSYALAGLTDKIIIGGVRLRCAEKSVIKVEVTAGRAEIDSIVTTVE